MNKVLYALVCLLFLKTGMKKALKHKSLGELEEWMSKAIKEEKYELAAYLKYYIEFKRKKKPEQLQL